MNLKEKFTFRGLYGTWPGCVYRAARYRNGNPALQIWNDRGCVCTCSVNPPGGVEIAEGEIAVKDWSENEGMGNWLKLHGVIVREDPVRRIPSGCVEIPVYRLTDEGKALYAGVRGPGENAGRGAR